MDDKGYILDRTVTWESRLKSLRDKKLLNKNITVNASEVDPDNVPFRKVEFSVESRNKQIGFVQYHQDASDRA